MHREHRTKYTRWLWLLVKAYAGLCTLFVTALLLWNLWYDLFEKPAPAPPADLRASFLASYGSYMADEYPKRGDKFLSLIAPLREYIRETPLPQGDLFRYLGRPDQFLSTNVISRAPNGASVTGAVMAVKYLIKPGGSTNTLAAVAEIADGLTYDITARWVHDYDQPAFQNYPGETFPNPQGGADPEQPVHRRGDATAAPAAPGRSP